MFEPKYYHYHAVSFGEMDQDTLDAIAALKEVAERDMQERMDRAFLNTELWLRGDVGQ